MPIGLGGVFGDMMLRIRYFHRRIPTRCDSIRHCAGACLSSPLALPFASGIIGRREVLADTPAARGAAEDDFEDDDNDDETASGGISQFVGAMTHTMLSATATFRRLTGIKRRKPREDEFGDMRSVRRTAETRNGPRHDPGFGSAPSQEPPFEMDDGFDNDGDGAPLAGQEWHDAPPQRAKARVGERAPSPKSGARIQREAQASFLGRRRI